MSDAGPDAAMVALLRAAGDAHHQAFAHVNGADPEWALWYAELVAPRLANAGGQAIEPIAVASALECAEAARKADSPDADWPAYYATWIRARWPWTVRAP